MSFLSARLYAEYALDIEKTLKIKEKKRIPFKFQSPEIQYRQYIVTWIRHAGENLKLSDGSVHLAVYLLDIFMDNHGIVLERLSLVPIVCLILAAKIEELDANIPQVSDLNQIVNKKYPLSDFICLEFMVIKFLKWNLILPTAVHFMECYLSCASSSADLTNNIQFESYQEIRYLTQQCIKDFLDQSLMDIEMHRFHPSLVAASCVAAARQYLCLAPSWTAKLIEITEYQLSDLQPCIKTLFGFTPPTAKSDRKRKIAESPDPGYETERSTSVSPELNSYKRSNYGH